MNDHADSSVSDVTGGAGEADDRVLPADGSVDEARDAEHTVPAPDGSLGDAVNRLGELDSTDVSEHPAIYEDIQRSLATALDDTPTTQAEQ